MPDGRGSRRRRALPGDRFGAVAMVIVEIGDQHPAAGRRPVGPRRDRHVVQKAESHPASRLGVVTRRPHERKNRLGASCRGLNRRHDAAGGPPRHRQRMFGDDDVAGRTDSAPRPSGCRLRAREARGTLRYGRAGSRRRWRRAPQAGRSSTPSGAQTSGDHLHAVGRFGMPDVTEVVAVDWIGDELQCALFAGWHESVADFLTLAYSFVPLRIIGSRRLYAATAFVH